MIGGFDYFFEVPRLYPGWLQEISMRLLRNWWPDGLVIVDELTKPIALRSALASPEVRRARDLFVHLSAESVKIWDEFGATLENENTMIYLIVNEDFSAETSRVTFVIDCPTLPMRQLLDSLKREMQWESVCWAHDPQREAA